MSGLLVILAQTPTDEAASWASLSWCAKLVAIGIVACLVLMAILAAWPKPGPAPRIYPTAEERRADRERLERIEAQRIRDLLDRYPEDGSR